MSSKTITKICRSGRVFSKTFKQYLDFYSAVDDEKAPQKVYWFIAHQAQVMLLFQQLTDVLVMIQDT